MQNSPIRKHPLALAIPLALLLLAACSSPPPPTPDEPAAINGSIRQRPEVPPMLGAAMVMMDFSGAPASAAVTEIYEGFYVGPLAPIGADGKAEIRYPTGSEIPSNLLVPVAEAVLNFYGTPACTVIASNPSVRATPIAFEGATVPGVALFTAGQTWFSYATAEELPDDLDTVEYSEQRFQTWMYATGATTLTTDPAPCVVAPPDTDYVSLNVSLQAGWNQLEWALEANEVDEVVGYILQNSTVEEVHFYPAFPLLP